MTYVKICGIRRFDDVNYLNKHLPEFAGFVFADSKRRVTAEMAAQLAANLDERIMRVGVFVNEEIDKVITVAAKVGLDIIQLHGDEDVNYLNELRRRLMSSGLQWGGSSPLNGLSSMGQRSPGIWKAIRVKNEESLQILDNYNADAFLLDAYSDGSYGGSGRAFDWKLAAAVANKHRIIVAGGLNINNVKEAIKLIKPMAVDVSSGVESGGFKDEGKIGEFIRTVRNAEKEF